MTESNKSRKDFPPEASIAVDSVSVESILCTEESQRWPSQAPDHEKERIAAGPLLWLAVTVTSEQHVESVLRKIVEGLASQAGVALVRIWLLPSVYIPNGWRENSHSQEEIEHLRLVASAGNPTNSPGEDWSCLHGKFARFPLNMGKVGQVAADRRPIFITDLASQNGWVVRPEWAEREEIRSFAGHPLIFQGNLLGVIGLFSRRPLDDQEFTWLGLFANHAAVAIANARAFEEVAERKKAEAEARKLAISLEAKVRRLVEANVVGIIMFTLEGTITAANEAFLQMAQYSHEDLDTGRIRWTDLTPADWCDRDERAITELKTTGVFQPFEKEYLRKDGTRVAVLLGGALFEETGNEGVAFILDLSEQKRAEEVRERLRQAQAELAHLTRMLTIGQVAASIAHEVNQPLCGIVTNASTCLRMLDADPPNLEGARETTRRTIRDANRASEVITRLRALFSKKSVAFESFDLNEAAKEVIALSLTELQQNKVILQMDLAAGLPSVLGDRIQIQQVILNLIRNGSEAMRTVEDRPRELLIKTDNDQGGGVRLSVRDTGVGFDPKVEEKLFEAFYTTKADGMGIGLCVSRSIMESHQGRLWATWNRGPGATFTFSIPSSNNT